MKEIKLSEFEIKILISLVEAEMAQHVNIPWEYPNILSALKEERVNEDD